MYIEREKKRKNESACQKFIVIAGLSVIRSRCSATSHFLKFTFVYISGKKRKNEREKKIRRILNYSRIEGLSSGLLRDYYEIMRSMRGNNLHTLHVDISSLKTFPFPPLPDCI